MKLIFAIIFMITMSTNASAKNYKWENQCRSRLETISQLNGHGKRQWGISIPVARYIPAGAPTSDNKVGSFVEYHGVYQTASGFRVLRGICAFSENSGTKKVPGSTLLKAKVLYLKPIASNYNISTRQLQMLRLHRWIAGTAAGSIGDSVAGGSNNPHLARDKSNNFFIDCRLGPNTTANFHQVELRCNLRWRVEFWEEEYGSKITPEYRTCYGLSFYLKKGKTAPLTTIGAYDENLKRCYRTLRAPPAYQETK